MPRGATKGATKSICSTLLVAPFGVAVSQCFGWALREPRLAGGSALMFGGTVLSGVGRPRNVGSGSELPDGAAAAPPSGAGAAWSGAGAASAWPEDGSGAGAGSLAGSGAGDCFTGSPDGSSGTGAL